MLCFVSKGNYLSGIDIEYLSTVASESAEIEDIARKALHIRNMIQRTQECLRAVDRVNKTITLCFFHE